MLKVAVVAMQQHVPAEFDGMTCCHDLAAMSGNEMGSVLNLARASCNPKSTHAVPRMR